MCGRWGEAAGGLLQAGTSPHSSTPTLHRPPSTVCTLADLSYDIYHATIDASEADGGTAQMEFYVR